jgi:cell shape-determining protein MreD
VPALRSGLCSKLPRSEASVRDAMAKSYAQYICITACLLFIQTTSMLPLSYQGTRPDLLLFIVLNAAVTLPPVYCACIIFMIGYGCEALSGSPTGLFISTYLLVFAAIKLLCRFFNFNTLVELFGLLLPCLVVKYLVLCFFLYFIYEYHYDHMLQTVFRETFFTIIVFPLIFPLLRKWATPLQSQGAIAANRHTHGA